MALTSTGTPQNLTPKWAQIRLQPLVRSVQAQVRAWPDRGDLVGSEQFSCDASVSAWQ
jgi:hypothetical protein